MKIKDVKIQSSPHGEHTIIVEREDGKCQQVSLNTPDIIKSEEMTRQLLNGIGNILTSLSCHLYDKDALKGE